MDAFFNSPLLLLPCFRLLCGEVVTGCFHQTGGRLCLGNQTNDSGWASSVGGSGSRLLECSIGVVRIREAAIRFAGVSRLSGGAVM